MKFYKKFSGIDFEKIEENLKTNWKLATTIIVLLIGTMALAGFAVFFLAVKSPELVLVPSVTGKDLTQALQEMQIKDLYPKIQLRYSNNPDEKGTVLEQSPSAGAIVKAGRRINLVVSQGVILDRVENYVGMKIDDVRIHLQTLFAAASQPMVRLPDYPSYKTDASDAGTILEQNPPANTVLSSPLILDLIVSSGPGNEEVRIPNITGLSLNDTLLQLSRNKIIFIFTAQPPEPGQKPGSVLSQKWPADKENLPAYSRVEALIAIPPEPADNLVYGILDKTLPPYPYALNLELKAEPPEQEAYTIVTLNHTGGRLTLPYAVPRGSRLILTALGKEVLRFTVQ